MILRTYMCAECGYRLEAQLTSDQWNAEPPDCPMCEERTHQEFKPPAIGGSHLSRATDLAHTIASEDYGVADLRSPSRSGPAVRYKDAPAQEIIPPSTWHGGGSQMAQALALGRETRLRHGNGLDVLQNALKSGAQPDLIEMSKRRSYRVY